MLGIGQFLPAYIFLGIALVLCAAKLAHSSLSANPQHPIALVIGCLLLVAATCAIGLWTHGMSAKADEDAKKLEPLKEIPGLKKQTGGIAQDEANNRQS
jgi:hypothetical protein